MMRLFLLPLSLCCLLLTPPAAADPPNFWDSYTRQGKVRQILRRAQHAYNQENYKEALYLADEARKEGADSADLLLLYGYSLLEVNPTNASEGASTLLAARELLPELEGVPVLQNLLALYYALMGEQLRKKAGAGQSDPFFQEMLQQASEELTALVNNPGATPRLRSLGWSNLGDVRMALYDVEGAIQAYSESLELFPWDNDYARFALAVALLRAGEEKRARDVLDTALRIDPTLESLRKEGIFFLPEEERSFFLAVAFAGQGMTEMTRYHLTYYVARVEEGLYRQWAKRFLDDIEGFCMLLQKAQKRPTP